VQECASGALTAADARDALQIAMPILVAERRESAERVEYRVDEIFDGFTRTVRIDGEETTVCPMCARHAAAIAEERGEAPVRIQSRTVTESPWTDLPEEGER
jgi:hypothetical protein